MGFGHCYSHDRDLTSIFVATRVCGVLGGVLWASCGRRSVWMDAPRGVRAWLCAYTDAYTYTCGCWVVT